MKVVRRLAPALALLLLSGCELPSDFTFDAGKPRPVPSVTQKPQKIDEDAFWAMIEDARTRGAANPDRIAAALDYKFYDADDQTISTFQDQLVAASRQLYTWRHGEAAELICGGLEPDGFAAWRYWAIAQGRAVFDRIVADADNLSELGGLDDGCDYYYDGVGSAAIAVWNERHPTAPIADLAFTGDPSGTRLYGKDIEAALPRLVAKRK